MARSQIPFQVRDAAGNVRSGVTCTVTVRVGGANALVWSLETGGSSVSGTSTTDANGWPQGWLDEGSYNILVTGTPNYTRAFEIVRGDGVGLFAANVITSDKFAPATLANGSFATDAVTTNKYAAATITNGLLADDSVDTRVLADNAVTEAKIATAALNARVVGPAAVTNPKVALNTVGTVDIADSAVTSAELAANAVTTGKLAADAVTAAKVQDASVTALQLAPGQIGLQHTTAAVIPIGFIVPFAAASAPSSKWLACQGQAVSRATYATLFAAIGTTYGAGDGSTTFNLPDLRGRGVFPVNASGTGITTPGANDGRVLGSRGPKHSHSLGSLAVTGNGDHQHSVGQGYWNGTVRALEWSSDFSFGNSSFVSTFGGGAHAHSITGVIGNSTNTGTNPNAAPWLTVQFIIRAL